MTRLLALLLPLSLLAGCLATENRPVRARRTPEELARDYETKEEADRRKQAKADKETLAQQLPGELRRRLAHRADRERRLRAYLRFSRDPWLSFEEDRLATLYRKWSDQRRTELPPLAAGLKKVAEKKKAKEKQPKDEEKEDEGGFGDGF